MVISYRYNSHQKLIPWGVGVLTFLSSLPRNLRQKLLKIYIGLWHNDIMILVFDPSSWDRISKTLVISWVTGVLGMYLNKPLNLSWVYADKVTLEDGGWYQRSGPETETGTFSPICSLPRRRAEFGDWLSHHAYVMGPPRGPYTWGSGSIHMLGGWLVPSCRGTELCTRGPSGARLWPSSSGSLYIHYNIAMIVGRLLPHVCEPLRQITEPSAKGVHGNPWFVAEWDRTMRNLGTHNLQLESEVGWGVDCGTEPLTHGVCANSGQCQNCLR